MRHFNEQFLYPKYTRVTDCHSNVLKRSNPAQWSGPPRKIKRFSPFFGTFCLRSKVLGVHRYKKVVLDGLKVFMCPKLTWTFQDSSP